MNTAEDECKKILTGAFDVPNDKIESHPLLHRIRKLERRSKSVRFIYPLVYLVLGVVLIAILFQFDPTLSDNWQKLFGAVIGVFSALLAFWNPNVSLSQSDCKQDLNEQMLAAADIHIINDALNLPQKQADNILKLIASIASFVAIYLLTVK